ncbi:hypothetical protein RDABS01_018297, partial [Bienertia sinuspersici]
MESLLCWGRTPAVSSNGQMRKIGNKKKLEDEVAELTIENTEQLAAISSTIADKKIYNVLVASWIFFAMCVCAFVVLLLVKG